MAQDLLLLTNILSDNVYQYIEEFHFGLFGSAIELSFIKFFLLLLRLLGTTLKFKFTSPLSCLLFTLLLVLRLEMFGVKLAYQKHRRSINVLPPQSLFRWPVLKHEPPPLLKLLQVFCLEYMGHLLCHIGPKTRRINERFFYNWCDVAL